MRTSRKRKSQPRYGNVISGDTPPTPARRPRMPLRADDSLYIAAVIGGASIFSWIVAVL